MNCDASGDTSAVDCGGAVCWALAIVCARGELRSRIERQKARRELSVEGLFIACVREFKPSRSFGPVEYFLLHSSFLDQSIYANTSFSVPYRATCVPQDPEHNIPKL